MDIAINEIGPVHYLPLHVKPGVNVLRGVNGCGKTESLAAVGNLMRGKGQLPLNDHAKAGSVEGLGVSIRVGKSTRYTGEMECLSLEGRFDIGDLVTPTKAHKNAEAVDRHRIKALIALEETKADATLYYDLVGQDLLERVMPPAGLAADDPLTLAENIQKAFHAAKRESLAEAARADTNVVACRRLFDEVDTDGESDAEVLQRALETALKDQARIEEQRKAATADDEKAVKARDAMTSATAEYDGPGVAAAKAQAEQTVRRLDAATAASKVAREALEQAQTAAKAARTAYDETIKERDRAVQHENMLSTWKATIDAAADVYDPGEETAAEAVRHVLAARRMLEAGHMIRLAQDKQAEAAGYREKAAEHRSRAERMRLAADAVNDVLSQQIATPLLRVKAGRLVTSHTRGPDTLYDELSDGERWTIALEIAIAVVGGCQGGLLVLSQEGWQGLDPTHRKLIAEQCEAAGVSVLTAEAAAGNLRVEHYQADSECAEEPAAAAN